MLLLAFHKQNYIFYVVSLWELLQFFNFHLFSNKNPSKHPILKDNTYLKTF